MLHRRLRGAAARGSRSPTAGPGSIVAGDSLGCPMARLAWAQGGASSDDGRWLPAQRPTTRRIGQGRKFLWLHSPTAAPSDWPKPGGGRSCTCSGPSRTSGGISRRPTHRSGLPGPSRRRAPFPAFRITSCRLARSMAASSWPCGCTRRMCGIPHTQYLGAQVAALSETVRVGLGPGLVGALLVAASLALLALYMVQRSDSIFALQPVPAGHRHVHALPFALPLRSSHQVQWPGTRSSSPNLCLIGIFVSLFASRILGRGACPCCPG